MTNLTRTRVPIWITIITLSAMLGLNSGCATETPAEQRAEAGAETGGESGFFGRVLGAAVEPVTVPSGTVLVVEFHSTLSSDSTPVGQSFEATVAQDVAVDGKVAIAAGSRVSGTVTEARGPKKVGGRSHLSLDFDTLHLKSGDSLPISASFAQVGKSETPKDAAIIGGSTLGGAILGEAIDEGQGTVVGGVVGAISGVAAAVKTKGKPVTVPAGTRMHLELLRPVVID